MNTESNVTNIEESLAEYGTTLWRGKGFSMEPLIQSASDIIVLERPTKPLQKYDIAVYRKDNNNEKDQYVLHRVIGEDEDKYIFLGDNCITLECVPKDRVLGVMKELLRDGRPVKLSGIKQDLYMNLWVKPWRMRIAAIKIRGKVRRAAKRILNK